VTYAGLLLLASAAALLVRWLLRRYDGLGRPRAAPLVSVLVLAAAGLGLLVPSYRHARLEHRLDAVASALVGVPVNVHCQTVGEEMFDVGAELGYVRADADGRPEHATLIKHGPCRRLADYLGSDHAAPSRDEIIAVHVLSHEARHMAGEMGEARAECAAMQRDARAAQLLGADPAQARALATAYWQGVYPAMNDDYRTGQCVAGGPLDEHLGAGPWPL
jgi:hypothetical protein